MNEQMNEKLSVLYFVVVIIHIFNLTKILIIVTILLTYTLSDKNNNLIVKSKFVKT